MSDKEVKVSYGLREKAGARRMVHLDSQENTGRDCCGEKRFELDFYEGLPLFRVKTPEKAVYVLAENTPWFNTDARSPNWGSVDVSTLEVVKITETVELETVDIQPPMRLYNAINSYAKPRSIAEKYLGRKLPERDHIWTMRLMHYPEGENFESLKAKCTDKVVLLGKGTAMRVYCWGIFEAPEEYVDLFGGVPGFCMFTSDTWFIFPGDDE